jgi:hypothetical protein
MSEREVTIRTAVVTYFPMFIAVLSLVTSIYNGYLNGKFVDIIQRAGSPGSSTRPFAKRRRHHPPSSISCSSRLTGFSPT